MGRASSSKKVARAARAAGRPGTGRNWLWPLAVFTLVALGVSLVIVSRPESRAAASPGFGDHWHAAFGVYACDDFAGPLVDAKGDANGIHTHPDSLVHIHPSSSAATGDNANVGVFAEEVDLVVEDDRLDLPGDGDQGRALVEGEDECGGEPGLVQLAAWDDLADEEPEIVVDDLADHKFEDGSIVTLAFAPEGAELPKPPSTENLAAPEDLPGPGSVPIPSSVPTAPEDSTSSTAPPDSTATTATTAP